MKRVIPVLFFVIIFMSLSQASTTTIRGMITGFTGKSIRLIQYEDLLTGLKKTLATASVDQDGRFLLEADLSETTWAIVAVGFRESEICLQPGQAYEIKIESEPADAESAFFDRSPLVMIIIKDDEEMLNSRIQEFNMMYNDFIIKNSDAFYRPGKKELFESFRNQVLEKFSKISNQYLHDYIRYKEASMEQFMRLKSRETLAKEYLAGQQVLYNNVEYFYFFSQFFDKYLLAGNRYISYGEAENMINKNVPARQILDTLKKDPVLINDYLRELVLLSSLKELYKIPGFKKPNILALAGHIKDQSRYEQNRKVAANLIERLTCLQPGTSAPEFALQGTDGKIHQLNDFMGKYIYLGFFISGNSACRAEMDQQSQLYPDFRDKVNFLSISADQDMSAVQEYVTSKNISWTVLYYGGDYDLLDSYEASAFPVYFIINPLGKILLYPAPAPTENIREVLEGI